MRAKSFAKRRSSSACLLGERTLARLTIRVLLSQLQVIGGHDAVLCEADQCRVRIVNQVEHHK